MLFLKLISKCVSFSFNYVYMNYFSNVLKLIFLFLYISVVVDLVFQSTYISFFLLICFNSSFGIHVSFLSLCLLYHLVVLGISVIY